LLVELADRAGLTAALSGALAGTRQRCSAHHPGRVLRDLAVMLADGGDGVTDMATYGGRSGCSARASETTTDRVIKSVDEQLLGGCAHRARSARAGVGRGRSP
jgi:hypothetical protein